ncbi:MAG: LysM domain-containing protein [Pseudomonadota bacterium]
MQKAIMGAALGAMAALGGLPAPSAQACERTYVAAPGDTLSLIAERLMGDLRAYRTLYAANRAVLGADPEVLEVGTVLIIPCDAAQKSVAAQAAATPSQPVVALEPRDPLLAPRQRAGLSGFIGGAALAAALRSPRSLQVVDVRADGSGTTYLPRAHAVPAERWADALSDPGAVAALIAEEGLTLDRPLVVTAADASRTALARASLAAALWRAVGGAEVAILWGGQATWEANRRPLWASAVTPRPGRGLFAARPTQDGASGTGQGIASSAGTWSAVAKGQRPSAVVEIVAGTALPDPIRTPYALRPRAERKVIAPPMPIADTPSAMAVEALVWAKALPAPWEHGPVGLHSADPAEAALTWFLLRHVAGLEGVWFLPAVDSGTIGGGEAARDRAAAPDVEASRG